MRTVIVRSPLRISFVGGGSDLPQFCNDTPGFVVSTTIEDSIYITVAERYDKGIILSYSKREHVDRIDDIENDIIRSALQLDIFTGVADNGLEISSISSISSGAGLGSSGSFTVGLVLALAHMSYLNLSDLDLFRIASEIEIHKCNRPVGYQDQAAAAFGGMRSYTFIGGNVFYQDLGDVSNFWNLQSRTLLVDTEIRQPSSVVLSEVNKNSVNISRITHPVTDFTISIRRGDIDSCGEILKQSWNQKKLLSPSVTNDRIDEIIEFALEHGAIGGKICGAGGRGMLLFITEEDKEYSLEAAINDRFRLKSIHPQFYNLGCEVIYSVE